MCVTACVAVVLEHVIILPYLVQCPCTQEMKILVEQDG